MSTDVQNLEHVTPCGRGHPSLSGSLLRYPCGSPLPRLRDLHRGHTGSRRGLYTHIRVFEHKAVCRRNSQPFRGYQKWLWIGLTLPVVSGADQSVEAVENLERF
jgi:hypothetical protein